MARIGLTCELCKKKIDLNNCLIVVKDGKSVYFCNEKHYQHKRNQFDQEWENMLKEYYKE